MYHTHTQPGDAVKSDVIIVGHGLAGALLTRHLLRAAPGLKLTVVELHRPRDSNHSQLGESTTEAGSWYLSEVLGLQDHLFEQHIPKMGLRFFFRGHGDFDERAELGILQLGGRFGGDPALGTRPLTWQLHRGRFDTHLRQLNLDDGVELLEGVGVERVEAGPPHKVLLSNGETREADWVIDASRTGVLDAHLKPLQDLPHRFEASWAWVDRVDPDELSSHPRYLAQAPKDLRWRSTCHWVSPRAWVWGIPLSDGSTSVGIVSDQPLPDDPNGWMGWFHEHEPELGSILRKPDRVHRRAVRSRFGKNSISPKGLARTGDAAGFLDPLYSSALDQTVVLNQLIVAAILSETPERTARIGNISQQQLSPPYQAVYRGLFDILHHPRALAAKVVWDHLMYFHGLAPMLTCGQLHDHDFISTQGELIRRISRLQLAVQPNFAKWATTPAAPASGTIDLGQSAHLLEGLARIREHAHQTDFASAITAGLKTLEGAAVLFHRHAAEATGESLPTAVNPYDPSLPRARHEAPPHLVESMAPTWLHAR